MRLKGFTLIEVLAAVAVLAGLMAVAAFSWSGNFRRLQKSKDLNEVSFLLEQKMSELEGKYKTEIDSLLEKEEGGICGKSKLQLEVSNPPFKLTRYSDLAFHSGLASE